MECILDWAQNASLHAVQHFIVASGKSFTARKVWAFLFAVFVLFCCYLQMSLIVDIFINKPTSVEIIYERAKYANFPNLVLCDLNQENDKGQAFGDKAFGNSSLMHVITMELALGDLFEAVRRDFRKNLSSVSKYPALQKLYSLSYDYATPEYRNSSKFFSDVIKNFTKLLQDTYCLYGVCPTFGEQNIRFGSSEI